MRSRARRCRDRAQDIVIGGKFWLWLHVVGALVWVALSVPGMTVWANSIRFVIFVSLYAIVLSHLVGVVSAIAARKADPDDDL